MARRKEETQKEIVTEVLGKKGDRGLDILTIIKKHDLPEEFPDKGMKLCRKYSKKKYQKKNMKEEEI